MAHDRYVELERHPLGGFGFSVIGGVDTHLPPMVCALVHNGSAQLTGKVSVFTILILLPRLQFTDIKSTIQYSRGKVLVVAYTRAMPFQIKFVY